MLKLLKQFTKIEWLLSCAALAFILLQVWMDLSLPDYMSEITTLVQTQGSPMGEILRAGGKMLGCALLSFGASACTVVCAARIASGFSSTLRSRLFHKVQSFTMAEIGKFSTASLITRSTNDVMQVQMLIVMGLQVLLKAPITAVWAIAKIAGKSWQWTFSTGAAVAVLLVIVLTCVVIAMPKFRQLQALTDDMNRITRENLTGLSVIRAYNAEEYQEKKFEDANTRLTGAQLFASRTMAFMMPGIQLVMNGLSLAVYWIGAYLIREAAPAGKLPIFSEMIVFSQYAMQVVMSFMMLVIILILFPRAAVAARRINEVLDTEASVLDGPVTETDPARAGEVEFRDVSFRYPDTEEDVLHHVSFTARPGETVAFIGSTGCGKSTVINLIPRFYDATEGQVLVDGVDVREYDQKALRNKIGYVSQKTVLFSGTVKSNVAYGDNGRPGFPEEDVKSAVRTAEAAEFVEQMEELYEARIAQGGSNLSGGQKQRLSIARAVCRKPEILIFDDSFSALDYKTDRKVRENLKKACGNATRLIVAQRIGTIRDADRIVVLENGAVAGIGTHRELMQSCRVYQQIALSQLSKEELA